MAGAVARRGIAGLGNRQLVIGCPIAVGAGGGRGPGAVLFREIHPTVVPRVAVGIEAARRLYRDERRLGDIARPFEERGVR